jgi:hypothetical protein
MDLAYVAHSARCALLLDADGICRWYLMKVDDEGVAASAARCIGAQFVATLDPDAKGLLGHEPAVGKNVLFARVVDGRVTLVRFGPLVQFDKLAPAAEPPAEADAPAATVVPAESVAPPTVAEEPIAEPAAAAQEVPEPSTAEHPRFTLVACPPPPPNSEPLTLPSAASVSSVVDERETRQDLTAEDDEHETAAGEREAFRPSGFSIRAYTPVDTDNIETAAFARAAAVVIRSSRRGMLPRRI